MAYEYVGWSEYPKMIYHATDGAKVVKDRAEQDSYGDEYKETPIYPTDPGAEVAGSAPVAEPAKPKRGRPAKAAKVDEPAAADEGAKDEGAKADETSDNGAAAGGE